MDSISSVHLILFVIGIIAANGDSSADHRKHFNEQLKSSQCPEYGYCFGNDHDQVTTFATKTAYPISVDERNDDQFQIPSEWHI